MSRILKRPMFRKGGSVEGGVMSLATGGRAKYAEAGPVKTLDDMIKEDPYLQEVYGLAKAGFGRDVQQERSDVLANLLIRGGLAAVSGKGATGNTLRDLASAFQAPTDVALKEMAALKQDPAKMLTAKTAIEQKGAERLKQIELQGKKLDAEKKASIILGAGATEEEIQKKAAEILNEQIFGVEKRFTEAQKVKKLEDYETNYGLTGTAAEEYFQFESNKGKIQAKTGKPVRSFLKGERSESGKVDYTRKARNKPDGIYIDPINGVYIEITNGIPIVIPNPLGDVKQVSSLPKIKEEIITSEVRTDDGISDATYG